MDDKVFVSLDYPGDLLPLDPAKAAAATIEIDLVPSGGKLTWTLTEISNNTSVPMVRHDPLYGWSLVIAVDTIFRIQLSQSNLSWRFLEPKEIAPPGPAIKFPAPQHTKYYSVQNQTSKTLDLHAKFTGNSIKQLHKFNVYVALEQDNGPDLFLVIDPITENPKLVKYVLDFLPDLSGV